jgi:hypothetical protein
MINLGFLTEGNLAAIFTTPSSWVPNGLHTSHQRFFGAVAREQIRRSSHANYTPAKIFWHRCQGGSRRFLRGEFFAHTSFTLFIVLLYFIYFTCIFLSETQKN